MANCDSCVYNVYDDDDECYYCEVDMDEDDAARLMQGHYKECPYYQNDDEYAVVRHQMLTGVSLMNCRLQVVLRIFVIACQHSV